MAGLEWLPGRPVGPPGPPMPSIRGRPRWVVGSAAPRAHCLGRPAAPRASERSSGGPVFLHDGGARGAPVLLVFSRLNSAAPAGAAFFLPAAARRILQFHHAPRPCSGRGSHAAPACALGRPRRASLRKARRLDPPRTRAAQATAMAAYGTGRPLPRRACSPAGCTSCPRKAAPERRDGQERHIIRRIVAEARSVGRAITASDGHRRGAPDRPRSGRPPGRRTTSAPLRPAAAASALPPFCPPLASVKGLSSGLAGASGAASTA